MADGWFIDAYRTKRGIALWAKTESGEDMRLEMRFAARIYIEPAGKGFLDEHKIDHFLVERFTYLRRWKRVYEIMIHDLTRFESFVRWIERGTGHRVRLYDADVTPEQQYMHKHRLMPGMRVRIASGRLRPFGDGDRVALKRSSLSVSCCGDAVVCLELDGQRFGGDERQILEGFAAKFIETDPDVILMERAFHQLPALVARLEAYGIACPFHRFDAVPIRYKGGKPFFSYGKVVFHDFAIRLCGRFLVDTATVIGGDCDVDGIMELCSLTGARFQHIASRSFGAAFQFSLVRLMYQSNYLVPHKEKPPDMPLSMSDTLKGDRAGHTFDAKPGFHTDVAEIDFTSMFPWIIYNKNISAETILTDRPPLEKVPGLPIHVSHAMRGLVPLAIKPILDRRMEYKRNPNGLNKARADTLKCVLVTAYGYLRFREFKLGVASSHMAICAYAREIIAQAARMAEDHGFEVVHGIVDSLYIRKKGICEEEVRALCSELESAVGIPVSFDGIFRWIVFLSSVNDAYRPLPATYYGVFRSGGVKARGIEVRQRKVPLIVKIFQQQALEELALCHTKKEVRERVPGLCRSLRRFAASLESAPPKWLSHKVRISTTRYKHDIPQKRVVERLIEIGVEVMPGQSIEYIVQEGGIVALLSEYSGMPDTGYYKRLLVRSLSVLLAPFGYTRQRICELSESETQSRIPDFEMRRECAAQGVLVPDG